MPQGDGTGPNGQGRMTGRRMGFCAGYNSPGYMNGGFGRGMGRGRGFRWRTGVIQPNSTQQVRPTDTTEKQTLEQELSNLKEQMKDIEERLKEFNK